MRTFLVVLATCLAAIAVLLLLGVSADLVQIWAVRGLSVLVSLACPLFFVTMLLAPGLGYGVRQRIGEAWERLRSRRAEMEELRYRIGQLGRPHHMNQLGNVYFRQGRRRQAAEWFTKALEKDVDHVEARYKLALCHLGEKRHQEAADLLEQVFARKPDYDYGGVYLQLARAHHLVGDYERAAEVYATLLRFYAGHPEGTYSYARLLEQQGQREAAREQMRQVLVSVRRSPPFQRRRNRHWLLKARWWLLRH